MVSAVVKISSEAHASLVEIAKVRKQRMSEVVSDLVEQERRRLFLERLNEDFARLRSDPDAWHDYVEEFKELDATLLDGLVDDPWEE